MWRTGAERRKTSCGASTGANGSHVLARRKAACVRFRNQVEVTKFRVAHEDIMSDRRVTALEAQRDELLNRIAYRQAMGLPSSGDQLALERINMDLQKLYASTQSRRGI